MSRVVPFPIDQSVETGEWIEHGFSIVSEDSSREGLEESIRSLRVRIGGEEVPKPQQYLTDLFENAEELLVVDWPHFVPPRPPGEYSFAMAIDDHNVSGTYEIE